MRPHSLTSFLPQLFLILYILIHFFSKYYLSKVEQIIFKQSHNSTFLKTMILDFLPYGLIWWTALLAFLFSVVIYNPITRLKSNLFHNVRGIETVPSPQMPKSPRNRHAPEIKEIAIPADNPPSPSLQLHNEQEEEERKINQEQSRQFIQRQSLSQPDFIHPRHSRTFYPPSPSETILSSEALQALSEQYENLDYKMQNIESHYQQLQRSNQQLQKAVHELQNKKYNKKIEENITSKQRSDWSFGEVIDNLPNVLPSLVQLKSRTYYNTEYVNCFLGTELVDALCDYANVKRDEAIKLGQTLLDNRHIYPCGFYNKRLKDKPLWYSLRDTIKQHPFPPTPTIYEKFIGRVDFEILDGWHLNDSNILTNIDTRFSVELIIESQIYGTHSRRAKGSRGFAAWNEKSSFFIFESFPILEVYLWKSRALGTKKLIGSSQISLWECGNNRNGNDIIQKRVFFSENTCVALKLKYTYLRNTVDVGTALSPDLRPLSWLNKDPFYCHKPHLRYNRCGISDIFCKLPPDATSTTDKLIGIFEFYSPLPEFTTIDLYVQKDGPAADWIVYDSQPTEKGHVSFSVPLEIQKKAGRYPIRMIAREDPSQMAAGNVFIAEPNSKLICFDIDGTLTTGDQELIKQMALDFANVSYNTKLRRQSVSMVRWWWSHGYLPVYLSGRQGSAYNFTRNWLKIMGYPPGIIGHTSDHLPTLPIYSVPRSLPMPGVGDFKRDYLEDLMKRGFIIEAVYGNTKTDIKVYGKLKIHKTRTYITGNHKKTIFTSLGKDFVDHINFLDANIPIADPPLPVDSVDW